MLWEGVLTFAFVSRFRHLDRFDFSAGHALVLPSTPADVSNGCRGAGICMAFAAAPQAFGLATVGWCTISLMI